MSNDFLYAVSSKPTVHFLDALAAAGTSFTPPFVATAINNIPGVPPIGSRRFLIRAIEYLSVQNVGLEFDFFGSAAGLTNVIATDTFISRYQFASANGVQVGGAGLYRSYVDGLAIPWFDADTINTPTPPSLHVLAQNCDTVAKLGDAAGAIAVTFWLQMNQAW